MNYLFIISFVFCLIVNVYSFTYGSDIESRIIGGSTASKSDFPYQVSIRTTLNQLFCGGSLISTEWILTAAHCVHGKQPSSMVIVAGTNYRYSGGEFYGVSRVVTHPGYSPQFRANDIALLKANSTIRYSKYVKAVSLASSPLPVDKSCYLTGWGLKEYPSNRFADKLRYIKLDSIDLSKCQSYLSNRSVNETNVCTLRNKGRGACEGDDGGPLVYKDIQYGVLSWFVPCAVGSPEVYMNVGYYRNWIKTYTGF